MIHIVCHDFKSTSGNHAGMRHLYSEIAKRISGVKLYVLNNKGTGVRYCNRLIAFFVAVLISFRYRKGDKFLFTEDIFKGSFQTWMISIVRFFHPNAPIYAMVHLTPSMILENFSKKRLQREGKKVTTLITLGSSLTSFFAQLGVENVHTSFHYLDVDYYNTLPTKRNKTLTVIVMGAMARNFSMIAEIIRKTPHVKFVLCKGKKNVDELFNGLSNVTLLGYLPEADLKKEMSLADISLNVMDDTIGSNVICTSLGMGLAMLCSDVGSIRDYCDESNTMFCSSADDFVMAIEYLSNNPQVLLNMRYNSYMASRRISIDEYIKDIWGLMNERYD